MTVLVLGYATPIPKRRSSPIQSLILSRSIGFGRIVNWLVAMTMHKSVLVFNDSYQAYPVASQKLGPFPPRNDEVRWWMSTTMGLRSVDQT